MNMRWGMCAIILFSISCVTPVYAQQQPPVQWLVLDHERIAARQAAWKSTFESWQLRKKLLIGGAGVVAAGGLAYIAYRLWFAQSDSADGVFDSYDANGGARAAAVKAQFEKARFDEWKQSRTVKGRMQWFAEQTVVTALATVIVAALIRTFSLAFDRTQRNCESWLGFNQEAEFTWCAQKLLRDMVREHRSLIHAVKGAGVTVDDASKVLLRQIRAHELYDVVIDHNSCMYALEDVIAFILVAIDQAAGVSADTKQQLLHMLERLGVLINQCIIREKNIIDGLDTEARTIEVSAIVEVIKRLFLECEHVCLSIGVALYGDNFALYPTGQAEAGA